MGGFLNPTFRAIFDRLISFSEMSLKRFLNFASKFDRPKVGGAEIALQIRNPQAILLHMHTGYQS